MKPLLLSLFLTAVCAYPLMSQSNEGMDFWLGFMEHIDINQNDKVLMITSRYDTEGTAAMPLNNWSVNFTVKANDITFVKLPSSAETRGSEQVKNTGIHVTAAAPISVYAHQYSNFRSEAAVILPTPSIGNEYYAMSYFGYDDPRGTIYPSEFLIVAVEDETQISFRPTDRTLRGMSAGASKTIMLSRGESYQVQTQEGTAGDLTGSYVVGDKPFALFSGAKWTEVPLTCGTRDNLYEQMFAVSKWGKTYLTVPNENASYDYYRVMAAEDNTQVYRDGTLIGTLDAGQFLDFSLYRVPSFVEGTKPLMVAQFNIGRTCNSLSNVGDPSMVLLNAVEQTKDTMTIYSSAFEEITANFVNIITRDLDKDSVKFDGQLIADQFQSIPSNSDYVYANLTVSAGPHNITSTGCGVIATAYGYGNAESYAYSAGASFLDINANPIPEGGCLNDTIFFSTGLPEDRVSLYWNFGDGTESTEWEPTHIYTELGTYAVELILTDHCLGTTDTLNQDLKVTLRQSLQAFNDTLVCEGEPVQLGATDLAEARYEWTGPNGYFSEEQFPILQNPDPTFTGDYEVIGIISGCATFPKEQFVEIWPTPLTALGNDTTICDGGPIHLHAGFYSEYLWQDGSKEMGFDVQEPGLYYVTITNFLGCVNTDSILISPYCPPTLFVPTAFTPNDDGHNDVFAYLAEDMTRFNFKVVNRWGQVVFETNSPGEYWDGRMKGGKEAPEGVYVWVATYEEVFFDDSLFDKQLSGTVTLIR